MSWEPVAGGGFIALLFGFILNGFRGRLNKVEQCKVDRKVCDERHAAIEQSLNRGDDKFDKLEKKIDTIVDTVIRIDERVDSLRRLNT